MAAIEWSPIIEEAMEDFKNLYRTNALMEEFAKLTQDSAVRRTVAQWTRTDSAAPRERRAAIWTRTHPTP